MISTYGSWLYGDSRGFRTRHHREHVEGDYRHPPPAGKYTKQEQKSRRSLSQQPVTIPPELREVIGTALVDKLQALDVIVVVLSVSAQHVHVLAEAPFGQMRELLGVAKKHAWFEARERGWKGKLWGKRSKPVPIQDRKHQLNVYRYILRHRREGAWVWSILEQKKK